MNVTVQKDKDSHSGLPTIPKAINFDCFPPPPHEARSHLVKILITIIYTTDKVTFCFFGGGGGFKKINFYLSLFSITFKNSNFTFFQADKIFKFMKLISFGIYTTAW